MRDPIAGLLAAQDCVILDGALATELERRGADLDDPLWSARCLIERPDLIRDVHRDYLAAGADVLTTATYQASFEGFARRGITGDGADRLLRDAVRLACAARDEFERGRVAADRRRPLVAASVGPYGAMLADGSEYRGDYAASDAELAAFHRPRLAVLASSGADLLACETLPCLREALVLARLLGDFPEIGAWFAFSCRDGMHTSAGEDLAGCVAALEAFPQVLAVGVNCTAPEHLDALLERAGGATAKPLVAYPNSGERYDPSTKCWAGGRTGSSLAARAGGWRARGARLIGGCCRTTPRDIAVLRGALLR